MYSYEIDNLLQQKNFHLNSYDELQQIKDTSSQLNRIKFEELGEVYSRYTIGTSDNCNWSIFIRNYNR